MAALQPSKLDYKYEERSATAGRSFFVALLAQADEQLGADDGQQWY